MDEAQTAEHPVVKAYIGAKEAELHYQLLCMGNQGVAARRDFQAQLVLALKRFFELSSTKEEQDLVDSAIFKQGAEQAGFSRQEIRDLVHSGKFVPMAMPSIAYCFYPLSCNDFRKVVALILIEVSFDEWAVDGAFRWLEEFLKIASWDDLTAHPDSNLPPGATARDLLENCVPEKGTDLGSFHSLFCSLLSRLLRRLRAAKMEKEAKRVKEIIVRAFEDNWFYPNPNGLMTESFRNNLLEGLRNNFLDDKPARVVLLHPHQAENARRLGMIDEKRYAKLLEGCKQKGNREPGSGLQNLGSL